MIHVSPVIPKSNRRQRRLQFNSDDLLEFFLWALSKAMMPTLGNLLESFEAWEYRNQFHDRLRYLERREYLQRETRAGQIVYRLTERGRQRAWGRDPPETRWARSWDGYWRILIFDLPRSQQKVRLQLLRWLRQNDFGFLQNSVWIRPDPITKIKDAVKDFRDDVKCLISLEARVGNRASCLAMVRGAWDFDEINRRYQTYLDLVSKKTRRDLNWFRQERLSWLHATSLDPFLPQKMLPPDYLGISAWRARQKILGGPSKPLSE